MKKLIPLLAVFALACHGDETVDVEPVSRVRAALDGDLADADIDAGNAATGRVTDGLIGLYSFAGAPTRLAPIAGSEQLEFELRGSPEFGTAPDISEASGGTAIFTGGYFVDPVPASVFDALTDDDGFTFELWVDPAADDQSGPARVISFSRGSSVRNITLGQEDTDWHLRFRYDNSDLDPTAETPYQNGMPPLRAIDSVVLRPQHLVVTYDGYFLILWLDGRQLTSVARPDGIANWDPTYGISLFNEFVDDRQFEGTAWLFAIYDRGLRPDEIKRNFEAGRTGGL